MQIYSLIISWKMWTHDIVAYFLSIQWDPKKPLRPNGWVSSTPQNRLKRITPPSKKIYKPCGCFWYSPLVACLNNLQEQLIAPQHFNHQDLNDKSCVLAPNSNNVNLNQNVVFEYFTITEFQGLYGPLGNSSPCGGLAHFAHKCFGSFRISGNKNKDATDLW